VSPEPGAGTTRTLGQHVLLLYDGAAEPLLPVDHLRSAAGPGDAFVLVGWPPHAAPLLEHLRSLAPPGTANGAITQLAACSDADELLDRILSRIVSLAADGHRHIRVMGLPAWGGAEWPAPEDFLWLESRLTAAVATLPATVVCGYDASRLPARALLYGEEVHPFTCRGQQTAANPLFIDADRWIADRGSRLPWLAEPSGRGPLRHIAAFYRGGDEIYRQLGPQISRGLDRGERAIHFIDPAERRDHEKRLAQLGVNVERQMESGHLDIRGWDEVYLLDGYFDQERQLDVLDRLLREPRPRIRLAANMAWALTGAKGVEDLVEYESRIDDRLGAYSHVVICAYDLDRFDAWTTLGVLRAHPAVLIEGRLIENSLYEPLGPRASAARGSSAP
jgi:DcmR-like sensory protein